MNDKKEYERYRMAMMMGGGLNKSAKSYLNTRRKVLESQATKGAAQKLRFEKELRELGKNIPLPPPHPGMLPPPMSISEMKEQNVANSLRDYIDKRLA